MSRMLAKSLMDGRNAAWLFFGLATVVALATISEGGGDPVKWSVLPVTLLMYFLAAIVGGSTSPFGHLPSNAGGGFAARSSVGDVGKATILARWGAYYMSFGSAIAIVTSSGGDTEVVMFLPIVAVTFAAAVESDRRLVTGYALISLVTVAVLGLTSVDMGWINWVFGLAFSWGFGTVVRSYSDTLTELGTAQSQVTDLAIDHERRRIARDVHDLVGHSLAVVMLHVTGARHLVHKDPDEAERALEQAETVGRQSMAEIRNTIGLLRDSSDGDSGVDPSPHLTDVEAMVAQYAAAGLNVTYRGVGPLGEVEGSRSVAGFRIAQEALANVTKHTSGSRVAVAVEVNDELCRLTVDNVGGRPVDSPLASGYGLVGMRERALSVGGSLLVGPTADGWSVEATLPRVDSVHLASP